MRILITGGAGFIGSHLAERLLEQGHEVTIIDAKRRREWPSVVRSVAGHDIYIQYASRSYLEPGQDRWDFIYHLAATVGVKRVLENPKECIENNLDSLHSVLSLGIPGLYTSTSEVYGKTPGPLKEESPLVYSSAARWSYATSKLIGEWLAKQAGWKTVRLFNVIGPRQSTNYGAVLPTFVRQALDGEPLTIHGGGHQTRTFIDVRDCVEILDKLREKKFDVVNVGGNHISKIIDLGIKVWETIRPNDWPIKTQHVEYEKTYPDGFEECPSRIPDLTKLHSLIDKYRYRFIEETIKDLAESLKQKEILTHGN